MRTPPLRESVPGQPPDSDTRASAASNRARVLAEVQAELGRVRAERDELLAREPRPTFREPRPLRLRPPRLEPRAHRARGGAGDMGARWPRPARSRGGTQRQATARGALSERRPWCSQVGWAEHESPHYKQGGGLAVAARSAAAGDPGHGCEYSDEGRKRCTNHRQRQHAKRAEPGSRSAADRKFTILDAARHRGVASRHFTSKRRGET